MIVLAGARVRLRPLRSEEFEGLRAAGGVFGIGIEGADCVMYGMTRSDYEGVKERWTPTS